MLRVSEHLDMCNGLVSRIDRVDAEVSRIMDAWTSVKEGEEFVGREPKAA